MKLTRFKLAFLSYALFDLLIGGHCGGLLPLEQLAAAQMTPAQGNITAASASCLSTNCVTLQLDGATGAASIQLAGTFALTAQFEVSNDNSSTYASINCTPPNSTTAVSSATATGLWQCNVAGFTHIRVRGSSYSSGTAAVVINSARASAKSGGGGGTVGPGTANTVAKFATTTTVGNSGITDDGAVITATEPFALSSTLNSVIPMQTAACPASGTAATVTWCADTGNLPAIEEGTGAKQYLSLQPNLTNDGTTGTTLNQLAKVNSSGNAINCLTTDTTVPCLPVNSNSATSGQAQMIAVGIASCAFDATAVTAGDYVVASTTVAGKCHDASSTRPSGVWVVGQATTTGLASTTQSILVDAAGLTSTLTLDQISDPAAAKSFNFANANFLTFGTSGSSATGANNLVTITDGANNSGTGAVTKLTSASGSNGFPLTVSLTGANTAAVTDIASFTQGGAPGTVAGVGLAGAGYHFTAQPGGTTSTTATNGGAGGGYSLTAGAGGSTLSGNATAGAGGGLTAVTGAGGTSSGSNANSNGGDITLTFGAAGTGGGGAAGRLGQLSANTLSVVTTTGAITLQPLSGQNISLVNGGAGTTKITAGGTAANNAFVVKYGAASPTGDAIQIQNSSPGTALAGISSTGTNSAAFDIYILNSSGATINSGAPVKWNTGTADTVATDATVADTVVIGVNEGSCTNTSVCRIAVQGLIADAISDGACSIGNWVQASNTSGDVHCVGTIGAVGTTIGIAANAVNGAGFHFIIVHE